MEQYIDKSALAAEIERRLRLVTEMSKSGVGFTKNNPILEFAISEYKDILSFIDTLEAKEVQEEPVNRTPAYVEAAMQEVEEKSKAFTEAHQGENADTILAQMRGEEPVSEKLKEEIDNYVKRNGYDGLDSIEEVKYIANHFAKWQKQQLIDKACEWIKEKWDDNYTMPIIIDSVIDDFKSYMEG